MAAPTASGPPSRARLRAAVADLATCWLWLGALAGLSRLPLLRRTGYRALFTDPATADLAQFGTAVLPVWAYLTAGEAGRRQAAWGKRSAGLVVTGLDGQPAGRARIAVRSAVKLLPWQLAHLALGRLVGPGRRRPRLAAAGFGAALGLAGASVGLAVVRPDGRALHDLVAGTQVRDFASGGRAVGCDLTA
ncbi:MAG TPA: RDD family protein [Jatrophihabitans sp.]|nr:RDD family protein [Jatrophihabitans sp.]